VSSAVKSRWLNSCIIERIVMKNVTVVDHPLVQHSLTRLRDKSTSIQEFRRLLGELATFMVYEATREFPLRKISVETPLTRMTGSQLKRDVIMVPVLRAGLGMLESALKLVPGARVGFIGLKREEETLQALAYYNRLPEDLRDYEIVLMDPMLATGGSTVAALKMLTERGARHVRSAHLLAAPEGIRHVHKHFPEMQIFTGAIDQKLNHKGFIVPGLGDAGDRLFGA
jgi:uracil phosphoribosyltransferase